MIKVTPSLTFNGQCEAAFKYYEKCLNGKITTVMRWGDSPMCAEVSSEWKSKIMHANFTFEGQNIIGSDSPSDRFEKTQGMCICLDMNTPAEADKVFAALAEKGKIQMPIQETFWAVRFGMLTDQFGIPWMINCGKPM